MSDQTELRLGREAPTATTLVSEKVYSAVQVKLHIVQR